MEGQQDEFSAWSGTSPLVLGDEEDNKRPKPYRPRTVTVAFVLLVTVTTLSYLGGYALPAVLVSARLLPPLTRDYDPRPAWALRTLSLLLAAPAFVALISKLMDRWRWRRVRVEMKALEADL